MGQTFWDASGPQHTRSKFQTPFLLVLVLSDPYVQQAAENLGKGGYVRQQLQRNYQIICNAVALYAFGELEKSHKQLQGGTGRTVQMAIDIGLSVCL